MKANNATLAVTLLSTIVIILVIGFAPSCQAKEIEVTKEWQELGENDTIPAGMHVRMDMTTGGKWVKFLDEEDDKASTSTSAMAVVQTDGTTSVQEGSEDDDDDGNDKKSGYDYEMMYRTLSKLPDEEKERIGGIPELPTRGDGIHSLSPEARKIFEERMSEIWEQRQIELKALEDGIVDLPEILKNRIQDLQAYLQDPTKHLLEMDLDQVAPEGTVTHIVSVLQDLEFHMADVDMARDFHTLGGWSLLVSLLSDDVHYSPNITDVQSVQSEVFVVRKSLVQRYAAWAVGTAVKNSGEFTPYAVETIKVGFKTTNAIDLAIDLLCSTGVPLQSSQGGTGDKDGATADPVILDERNERMLREKAMYAIGSLLRGNQLGQQYFCSSNSRAKLNKFLSYLSSAVQVSSGSNPTALRKLTQRLLALAGDMIVGINDNESEDEQQQAVDANSIASCFSTDEWCDFTSTLVLTEVYNISVPFQQTLLETIKVLAPHCSTTGTGSTWTDKSPQLLAAVQKIQSTWTEDEASFDKEIYRELNDLVQSTIEQLNE